MEELYEKTSNNPSQSLTDISGKYDFESDVITGEQGEEFVKDYLIDKGYLFVSDNKDNKYDLLMSYGDREIKYEIKTDVLLSLDNDTGNLVVEFESRGKPSGIRVTEAEYYVYYIPKLNEIWNIKMNDLRDLIDCHDFKEVVGGDEGSNTKMYLINRNKHKKHFKVRST